MIFPKEILKMIKDVLKEHDIAYTLKRGAGKGIDRAITNLEPNDMEEYIRLTGLWESIVLVQKLKYISEKRAEDMILILESTLEENETFSMDEIQLVLERMKYKTGYWLDILADKRTDNERILKKLYSNIDLISWLTQHPGIFYVLLLYSTAKFEPVRWFIEYYIDKLIDDPYYSNYYANDMEYPKYISEIPSGEMRGGYYQDSQKAIMNTLEENDAGTVPAALMIDLFDEIDDNDFYCLDKLAKITTCKTAERELYIVMIDFVDYLADQAVPENLEESTKEKYEIFRELYQGELEDAISDLTPAKKYWTDRMCEYTGAKLERNIDSFTDVSLEDMTDRLPDGFDEFLRDVELSIGESYDDEEFYPHEDWTEINRVVPVSKEAVYDLYPDGPPYPMGELEKDEFGILFYAVDINENYKTHFLTPFFSGYINYKPDVVIDSKPDVNEDGKEPKNMSAF